LDVRELGNVAEVWRRLDRTSFYGYSGLPLTWIGAAGRPEAV